MSERDLSRQVATRVVEALRSRGRIAVVKGGAAALTRELAGALAPDLHALAPRLGAPGADGAIADALTHLGERVSQTLVQSEHLEDVFADEDALRRDVHAALRLSLDEAARAAVSSPVASPPAPPAPAEVPAPPALTTGDEAPQRILVRFDTLGYVASTVGKRAPAPVLREALERAADEVGGALIAVDVAAREAEFALTTSDPDARLDLEEAVADELSALLEAKVVALPTVVRRVELSQPVPADERPGHRPRIDTAATRTLLRSGCAAVWEFEDDRTLKVTVTPLSEQDALEVDRHVSLFARELASTPQPDRDEAPPASEPAAALAAAEPAEPAEPPEPPEPAAEAPAAEPADEAPAPAPTKHAAAKKAPAKKAAVEPAPKKTATKTAATTKTAAEPAAKKTAKKVASKKMAAAKAAAAPAAKKTAKKTAKKAR